MFSSQNFPSYCDNNRNIIHARPDIGDNRSAFINQPFSQNPFNLPRNFGDNYTSFSSNTCYNSTNSTNASIAQMTSLYMENQRKKAFTDELNLCLKRSLEKILPVIAKQTAEVIYNSISQVLIEMEKNMRELKNDIDGLRATLQSSRFLTTRCNDMKNINNVYDNFDKISGSLNNCGILLNNQIKFAEGNEEFKNQQQELIKGIVEKFEQIKNLLEKQKNFSGRLNECIKTSLANIIATKTNYKNEMIKMQDNIKYDIMKSEENIDNKNLINQINDISTSVNDLKNKVDLASDIYLKPNSKGDSNRINIENDNSNNESNSGRQKLRKLFSTVNNDFKF